MKTRDHEEIESGRGGDVVDFVDEGADTSGTYFGGGKMGKKPKKETTPPSLITKWLKILATSK